MSLSRRHFLTAGAASTAVIGLGLSPAFGETSGLPDWHLGYTSAPAGGFDPAPMRLVYGKVPTGLNGTLYRNGPAQFLYGKDDYASHWFDGDGMVQRIAIGDGQAVHSGRFVQTVKREIEQAHGKFMAPGFGTHGHPDFPVMGPDDVNAANTSVIVIDGKSYRPTGNSYEIQGIATGRVEYEIRGQINCPRIGSCYTYGSGTIKIEEGRIYNVKWHSTAYGQCTIALNSGY